MIVCGLCVHTIHTHYYSIIVTMKLQQRQKHDEIPRGDHEISHGEISPGYHEISLKTLWNFIFSRKYFPVNNYFAN